MKNFDYQTPTRLIFGRDVVAGLPEVMRPFGRRILLTYGGGSIKRIGLYDRVKELLKDFEIFELGVFYLYGDQRWNRWEREPEG